VYTFTLQTQMDSAQCPLSKNVATNRESIRSIKSDLESADRQARVATLGLSNSLNYKNLCRETRATTPNTLLKVVLTRSGDIPSVS
jgi:hypothetical protein